MSTGKRLLEPYALFTSQAVSSTTTYTSPATCVKNMDTGCIEIFWTGTPTGTFTLLGSVAGKVFQPLPSFAVTSPSGVAGSTLIDLWGTGVFYLQLQYVNASGSGTISANIAMKAF